MWNELLFNSFRICLATFETEEEPQTRILNVKNKWTIKLIMRKIFITICILLLLTLTNSVWDSRRRRRRRSRPICSSVNCQVGGWTSWSSCSHRCGTSGIQQRTRQQTVAASCGGTCPYHFHERMACNRDSCRNGGSPYSSGCSCRLGYRGTCCEHSEFSTLNFPLQ